MDKTKYLKDARKNKEDEFYTSYEDIEKEIKFYTDYLKNKIIYCNCDDGFESNFFKYFFNNFDKLKIKKLICTGFSIKDDVDRAFIMTNKTCARFFVNDGNYKNNLEYLKEADVIITNPPFSLFRDYIELLIKYNKKFLILCNQNVICYSKIFPLVVENKIWFGHSIHSGMRWFVVPDNFQLRCSFAKYEKDKKKIYLGGIRWITNIKCGRNYQKLNLNTMAFNLKNNEKLKKYFLDKYGKIEYPKYDNFDAIEVPFTKCIPKDYDGIMAVPITYFDKYDFNNYEIVGELKNGKDNKYDYAKPLIKNKSNYMRLLIRKRSEKC